MGAYAAEAAEAYCRDRLLLPGVLRLFPSLLTDDLTGGLYDIVNVDDVAKASVVCDIPPMDKRRNIIADVVIVLDILVCFC